MEKLLFEDIRLFFRINFSKYDFVTFEFEEIHDTFVCIDAI